MELTREYILGAINARNDAAINALLGLYERQTADEQNSQLTSHQNGMGFNGTDASFLSSLAEQAISRRARGAKPGTELSEKQLTCLRKNLQKYGRQLLEIAQEKAAARAQKAADAVAAPSPEREKVSAETWKPSPLDSLPSGLVATDNGWRWKTAKEFHAEGVFIDFGSMIRPAAPQPTVEPISDFERCFLGN